MGKTKRETEEMRIGNGWIKGVKERG